MTNMSIIEVLPNYCPKIDDVNNKKIDLNIRDLQIKYPNGCVCCNVTYLPKKYSSLIAQHFNTKKHKKLCLDPANEIFKQDCGSNENILDIFDLKCKENRELKKLNYSYKEEIYLMKEKYEKELENIRIRFNILQKLNMELQEKVLIKNTITGNLIDF